MGMLLAWLGCTTPTLDPADRPERETLEEREEGEDAADPAGDHTGVTEEEVPSPVYTEVPVFFIDTGGAAIPDGDKIAATLEVIRDHDGTLTDLATAERAFEGPIGIELHGSSSLYYPKLGYRFETRDEAGEDRDVSLLDLPEGSDWVLHGPYADKTLIRNALAYTLAAALAEDTGEYQPRTAFLELFLNETYQGVYLLVERVMRGEGRLDLPAPADTAAEGDLSGGYIVKVDQHRSAGFTTTAGTLIDYHYPRAEAITAEQDAYLQAYFASFEAMLQSAAWSDASAGWPAWIAASSWVDHFILNELAHNIDAYRLSAYLYKEADADGGRLHAGPAWDFDRAWGNVNYCGCYAIEGFIIDDLTTCGYPEQFPFWWRKLLSDPAFTAALRCRWEELRAGALSDAALQAAVRALVVEIAEVEPRDAATWGTLGVYVDPNYYVGATWEDELAWMEAWILDRAAWLDGAMPGTCGG